MVIVDVSLRSTRPLLMGRYTENPTPSEGRSRNAAPLTPADICEMASYRLNGPGSGLYIPSIHLLCAIREGARVHKIGKRAAWRYVFPAVNVLPEKLDLGQKAYEIDEQPVVNKTTGARIMSYRPRLNEWRLNAVLEIQDDLMNPELVRKSLVDGGRLDGLGTFRQRYGKFEITKWTPRK